MKELFTFTSTRFQPPPGELDENSDEHLNDGIFGKQLSDFLVAELHKIEVEVTFRCGEDWGWYHEIKHDEPYRLGFGCQNYEGVDHLVQFIPQSPYVRRWFKKYHAAPKVAVLKDQIMGILTLADDISNIKIEDG